MDRLVIGLKAALLLGLLHIHHHFRGPAIDYLGLAAAAFASWSVIPGPGEPVLIAESIFAARHNLDISSVLVIAWLGAAAGGMAAWLVGLKAGRLLVTAPGPLHRQRLRALERGEEIFSRHAVLAIYLTPAWVAGIHRVGSKVFIPVNAVTAAIWATLIGLGAYFAGPPIVDLVTDMGLVTAGVLVLLVGGSILAERRRRAHRHRAHDAHDK